MCAFHENRDSIYTELTFLNPLSPNHKKNSASSSVEMLLKPEKHCLFLYLHVTLANKQKFLDSVISLAC